MPTFCLSFHASYGCRHSGACCTAGWPIAAEPPLLAAIAGGGVRPAVPGIPVRFHVDGATVAADAHGCAFLERDGSGLCAIHRHAGLALLPTACRNFPRVTLRDGRGTFITLSHYCPTAASLLLADGAIEIVSAPDSLSLADRVEGLDATAVLPPLLRPGMLMDLDGYAEWERQAVRTLGIDGFTAGDALTAIARATGAVVLWSPGGSPLTHAVRRAFDEARAAFRPPQTAPVDPLDAATRRFLAAHLFGSWEAYQGGGITAVVAAVERAERLLRRERLRGGHDPAQAFHQAVRTADLELRHSSSDVRP